MNQGDTVALGRRRRRGWLIAALTFTCLILGVLFFGPGKKEPRLSIIYLGQVTTNPPGAWYYRFAVTNEGNGTAVSQPIHGDLETFNGGHTPIGVRSTVQYLRPGMTDVIEVMTPAPMTNRWRLNCFYAHDTIKSRIYHWQWGPNGPAARANWMVPRILKGMRMDVMAANEWIDAENTNKIK